MRVGLNRTIIGDSRQPERKSSSESSEELFVWFVETDWSVNFSSVRFMENDVTCSFLDNKMR